MPQLPPHEQVVALDVLKVRLASSLSAYEYMTLEYRSTHATEDIAKFCDDMGRRGFQLTFVLESTNTLIFERELRNGS